jgi:hypothetical protein
MPQLALSWLLHRPGYAEFFMFAGNHEDVGRQLVFNLDWTTTPTFGRRILMTRPKNPEFMGRRGRRKPVLDIGHLLGSFNFGLQQAAAKNKVRERRITRGAASRPFPIKIKKLEGPQKLLASVRPNAL